MGILTWRILTDIPWGWGILNRRSKITVRMLTRDPSAVINDSFIQSRVKAAWEYRRSVTDISSCRLIFGEADFLPGLVVDKYEDVLVVESLALGIDRMKQKILQYPCRYSPGGRDKDPRGI